MQGNYSLIPKKNYDRSLFIIFVYFVLFLFVCLFVYLFVVVVVVVVVVWGEGVVL